MLCVCRAGGGGGLNTKDCPDCPDLTHHSHPSFLQVACLSSMRVSQVCVYLKTCALRPTPLIVTLICVTLCHTDTCSRSHSLSQSITTQTNTTRYLDLHELHRVFTNAKFGRQIDYLEYLGSLSAFGAIPKHERLKAPYRCVFVWCVVC